MRRIALPVALMAALALIFGACQPAASPAPGDTPGAQTPGAETPGTQTPGAETPGAETPGTQTPGGETPGTETPGTTPGGGEGFLACMVSDVGGIDDRSFNENAWAGMQMAEQQLGVEVRFLASASQEDYARNINQHINDGCNMIVTVGFLLGDDTYTAAQNNPDVRFAIVDYAYGTDEQPDLPNLEGLIYATEEAAMLAGYASASWSRTGVMGTFGGIQIPPVTAFMDGFLAGANYYNEQKGANVRVLGWDGSSGSFTGNFDSLDDARELTVGMLQENADVILPVGGPIGQGTFAAIQDQGAEAVGLGVDVDWTETVPQYSDLMLTHILKRIDNSVFLAIERAVNGEAPQPFFLNNLENEGVGLGEFHDYEGDITDETRSELEQLQQDIIDGNVVVSEWINP
ncbi:MAG TPA: BMP family ABC transporter substrate-binding protein [Candidatus Limnocylindrales bacterium]|nr:BMP family ABC transporter substrate-binding protein [Candidatus Limnocylindrales bacterium]